MMKRLREVNWFGILFSLLALLLFWVILFFEIPVSVSRYFYSYSLGLFLIVLLFYYLSFRSPNRYGVWACLGFTMLLLALTLSYKWTSGFSDNVVIGGLVPYKDAKYYYFGSNLILNGLPPLNANQSTERPLFPAFFASVLLLTGQNLKVTLGIIVQLAGIGIYLSARQISRTCGAWSAGLFATLLYFYIQHLVGYAMSEMLGFTLGCLGFTLFWFASHQLKKIDLLIGFIALMVAISARAGAFFIFPTLAIWLGWVFREKKPFSLKVAFISLFIAMIGYLLVNSIYPRLLGIPPGSSFGNFSYALYGQARGGIGWYSAITELGTRNPSIVYREALKFFIKHPISLFIGFAKAYRDFFFIGGSSVFPFGEYRLQNWLNVILWMGMVTLLLLGLMYLLKNLRSSLPSLLLAGFAGIFLSIPFLPPIDGGSRFYASTMPFFFALPALGLAWVSKKAQDPALQHDLMGDREIGHSVSIILIVMTLIVPLVMRSFSQIPDHTQPPCPPEQSSFVIEVHPDSYIDLIKGSSRCGPVPNVCFDDFKLNNTEKTTDDFYWELFSLTENNKADALVIPAIDWVGNKFHYFYLSHDKLPGDLSSYGLLSGCAVEIKTTYQSIYKVESVLSGSK